MENGVLGRYRVIRPLGDGGMASVYLATYSGPESFSKKFALKVVHPHLARQEQFARRFINEARLGGHLSHSNIVQTLDFGDANGEPFMVMEYVDGVSLEAILEVLEVEGMRMPPDVAIRIIIEVCRGLEYAHHEKDEQGNPLNLVHRDLKPSNIMISRSGEVKIADFGIARASLNQSQTLTGDVIRGTVRYMSPEQAMGDPLDHRSDLFAVGAILFELLSGVPLYTEESMGRLLRQAMMGDNEGAIARFTYEPVTTELRAFLSKALAREPADRYARALRMELDLSKILRLLPDEQPLKSWLEPLLESASRLHAPSSPSSLTVGDNPTLADQGGTVAASRSILSAAPPRAFIQTETGTEVPSPSSDRHALPDVGDARQSEAVERAEPDAVGHEPAPVRGAESSRTLVDVPADRSSPDPVSPVRVGASPVLEAGPVPAEPGKQSRDASRGPQPGSTGGPVESDGPARGKPASRPAEPAAIAAAEPSRAQDATASATSAGLEGRKLPVKAIGGVSALALVGLIAWWMSVPGPQRPETNPQPPVSVVAQAPVDPVPAAPPSPAPTMAAAAVAPDAGGAGVSSPPAGSATVPVPDRAKVPGPTAAVTPTPSVRPPKLPAGAVTPPVSKPRGKARLSVEADVPCSVSLDGKSIGETPLADRQVSPGRHTLVLEVRGANGQEVEGSFEAEAGGTISCSGLARSNKLVCRSGS